ncbi:ATP-binding protein [Amycolatopsis sp. NPDC051102]|uniref:ATP-binding protein n=1 Tax=Amycolatopsis sp. NPDC051102 TaxID=3155163 RepID=UPI00344A6C1A
MTTEGDLKLVPRYRPESTVATLTGTLTLANYPELRDGVLKAAADAPESIIADIQGLEVDADTLVTVFSVIAMRIGEWPGIPFAVVTDRPDHLARLAAQTVDRFVAVHPDVVAAERARDRPPRRRAVQLLAASPRASALGRSFVERVCAQWGVPEHIEDALMIATELVENAIVHTTSHPRLRLELRGGVFTVAVADDDPRAAVMRELPDRGDGGLGLQLVARTARVWGCSRSWTGGKVVWAVLARSGRSRHDLGG